MEIIALLGLFVSFFAVAILYCFWEVIYNVKITKNLAGKHIVVTGGSSGIGMSVAIEASKYGANVTIIARNEQKLQDALQIVTASCSDPSQKIITLSMDVTQSYELTQKRIVELEEEMGPVYMLVNCAGSADCATVADATETNFRRMIDLNFLGTVLPTKAVSQRMVERQQGIIVVTASLGSLLGLYGMSAYCASKWALRGFAETLFHEMAPHNVSVTLCVPPDTDTPGFEAENKDKPEVTKQICESGGLFSPDAVAKKLLSDALKLKFWSAVGFEGVLLTLGCAGFSPFTSISEVFLQVIMASLVRLVGIFHLMNMASIISNSKPKK